jgi:hypothetical protein
MSVSSGSDVTIPIQDSPPPPPSPYGNRKASTDNAGSTTTTGVENGGFQAEASGALNAEKNGKGGEKKAHTEIPMSEYSSSNGTEDKDKGRAPSSPPSSPLNEAVNSELVNMNVLDTIPHKPQSEFGPYENFDAEYFISVNQHKKFLRSVRSSK